MGGVVPTRITFASTQSRPEPTSFNEAAESMGANPITPAAAVASVPTSPEGPLIGLTMIDDDRDTSLVPDTDMILDSISTLPESIQPDYTSSNKAQTSIAKPKSNKKTARPPPELIPPSRRTDLPSNIIVSSVNVESDIWGDQVQAKSSHDVMEEDLEFDKLEANISARSGNETKNERKERVTEDVIRWDSLDDSWDSLEALEPRKLQVGSILAWQVSLFSPELDPTHRGDPIYLILYICDIQLTRCLLTE